MNTLQSLIGVQTNAATLKENSIKMVASACGVLLRNGAVILPGAFPAKVLRDSVKTGWMDVSHEWDGEPIGIFDKVYMEGDELIIEASFHSHEEAQMQRSIVSERLMNGKEVAVSIGYGIDYEKVRYFESGKDLWKYCEDEGYDMSRFDKAIKKESRWCWVIPSVTELNEVSICNIGMNPNAKVLEVNASESEPNEELSGEVLSLSDALDAALGAVERAQAVHELRKAKGSRLGDARLNQLSALNALVSAVIADATAPTQEEEKRAAIVRQKLLLAQATLAGV
jgi:hypothetical protein